jgi:actin-related protein
VLFHPDLIGEECEGLHEALVYSIQKSDLDVRKKLYQSIVLAGGSTLLSVSIKKKCKSNVFLSIAFFFSGIW